MSDRENDMTDAAVDPPENQPGGQEAMNLESPAEEANRAVDPPENQPGGGRAAE